MVTARNAPHSTATGVTSINKLGKIRVYLEYACYICGNVLSSAKSAINHCERIHGYSLPTRQVGHNRPQDNTYEYVRDRDAEVNELHYACSSCWFHCPEDEDGLQALNDHVREEHDPEKTDITKEGGDTLESREKNGTPRRGSTSSGSGNKSDSNRSRGGSSTPNRKRSTTPNGTPITEESAHDIATKLDELIELFKKFM